MDPESRKLLEDTHKLSEENNKMLHSMRRSMRNSRIMTFIYWTIIIGSAVGAYYFVEPYIDQLIGVYGGAKSNLSSFNELLQNFKK